MHIITRKRLNDYADLYPETAMALEHWYKVMKHKALIHFELKTIFAGVDKVGKLTVFIIGGNKVRLIAAIHYNIHKVVRREVV